MRKHHRQWFRFAAIVLLTGMAVFQLNPEPGSVVEVDAPVVKPLPDWTSYRLIAHEMGGIDGYDYTSSREAFFSNYEQGHRLFETDLILTSDNHLAGRHDWEEYLADQFEQDIPVQEMGQSLTLKEFKEYKIHKKYHPMSFNDVARLMKSHPDIYVSTDTKDTDEDVIEKQFKEIVKVADKIDPSILERVVPEIYTPEMYDMVMNMYPFPQCIYSTYMSSDTPRQVVDFVTSHNITAVVIPTEDLTPEFLSALKGRGIKIYVSTVNTPKEIKQYLKKGVYGFYTDFLNYQDLRDAGINLDPTVSRAVRNGSGTLRG